MGKNTKKKFVPPSSALAASSAPSIAAATGTVTGMGDAGCQPRAASSANPTVGDAGCQPRAASSANPTVGDAGCQPRAASSANPAVGDAGCQPRAASSANPAAATVPIPAAGAAGCLPPGLGGKTSVKNANSGAKMPWSSLFKDNRSSTSGAALTKVTDGVVNNTIYFDVNEFDNDDCQVSRSLIGFFSPKFPGIDAIMTLTDGWLHKCKVSRHTSSWIVFSFSSKVEAMAVLEAGPYQSFGNLLHLRAMPQFFSFGREAQRSIPVWVQFHNLPLEFWRPRLLSKLCTSIGLPLHTDQLTENMDRISFARCLVEVDVQDDLPEQLTINLSDGTTLSQPVLYENKPLCCGKCKRIGHASTDCRDTGVPTLYVMRKPVNKVGKVRKAAATSAPTSGWTVVGRKKISTVIDPQVVPEAIVSAPPGPSSAGSHVEEVEDIDDDSEDGSSGDVSAFGDVPPVDPGDRVGMDEARLDVGLKASASHCATSSSTPAPAAPLTLSGQSDPPSDIPLASWPTVQDASSSARTTRSRAKK